MVLSAQIETAANKNVKIVKLTSFYNFSVMTLVVMWLKDDILNILEVNLSSNKNTNESFG